MKAFEIENQVFFMYEYMDTNLLKFYQNFRKRQKYIPSKIVKSIIKQISEGLLYLHGKGFMHRDIKPENILINSKNEVKIADFGFLTTIYRKTKLTKYISTRWYRPPEILLNFSKYNEKIDIFALGCIMAELITL